MRRRNVVNKPVGITSFILVLWVGSSWGQVPSDNDKSDANDNTGGGRDALASITEFGAQSNTAYGFRALLSNTTGDDNTASGVDALLLNTTGSLNTAIGFQALANNTTGIANTASGAFSLYYSDTGSQNTASGIFALFFNDTGADNVGVGFRALENNTTGSHNVGVGALALLDNDTGSQNTAIGVSALAQLEHGDNNIAIGSGTGIHLKRGNSNVYIGSGGAGETADESNTIRLGNNQTTRTVIIGILNAKNVSGNPVMIDTHGQLGINVSSARYKRDIQTMGTRSQGLLKLRPVTFRYKQDVQELQYGLIAEEVAKVYPELVTRDANGEVESVLYHELTPMLLNELQHQQGQLSILKAENERLRAMVVQQQERDAALGARLERLEAAAARATTLASW